MVSVALVLCLYILFYCFICQFSHPKGWAVHQTHTFPAVCNDCWHLLQLRCKCFECMCLCLWTTRLLNSYHILGCSDKTEQALCQLLRAENKVQGPKELSGKCRCVNKVVTVQHDGWALMKVCRFQRVGYSFCIVVPAHLFIFDHRYDAWEYQSSSSSLQSLPKGRSKHQLIHSQIRDCCYQILITMTKYLRPLKQSGSLSSQEVLQSPYSIIQAGGKGCTIARQAAIAEESVGQGGHIMSQDAERTRESGLAPWSHHLVKI